VAAGLTAAAFTALAIIAIAWGAAHIVVGVPLRRHRPWSRLVALMLGAVDLLLLPYGTALGIYAIWILLNEDAKKLFQPALAPSPYPLAPSPTRPTRHGSSRVPAGVHGPQRATRASARAPPRITPSRMIAVSAYRLQVGVNRHRTPMRAAAGDSAR